jgi:cytochrome d ubiquinol oxidase subunit II
MFPSSLDPKFSLTAHNASASPLTLKIMLLVVLIFVPVVLVYQAWAYKTFSGKVTEKELAYDESY